MTSRQNYDSIDDEFNDALPSKHMMKYSKLNTSEKKEPKRTIHFNGPVKLNNHNKRINEIYYNDTPDKKKISVFGRKNSH